MNKIFRYKNYHKIYESSSKDEKDSKPEWWNMNNRVKEIIYECFHDFCFVNSLNCDIEFGVYFKKPSFFKRIKAVGGYWKNGGPFQYDPGSKFFPEIPDGFYTRSELSKIRKEWTEIPTDLIDHYDCVKITIRHANLYNFYNFRSMKDNLKKYSIKTDTQEYKNCLFHLKSYLKREFNIIHFKYKEIGTRHKLIDKIVPMIEIIVSYE